MPLSVSEAKALLWSLVRGIDRKADLSVTTASGDTPGVCALISLRDRKTTLMIPTRDLESALQTSMQRTQLRTTLKRAIDRMKFTALPVASTKIARGPAIEGGFFRAQPGGRGGRR
ncbi:MAG: hypothetical protein AB7V27_08255 [Candidatus Binatia bacterium]